MILGGLNIVQTTTPTPEKRRLAGLVTVNSFVASKRVVVKNRGTNEYVASTHSWGDGSWEIRGMPIMPERSLVATAHDDTGQYNSEILDFLSQVE